MHGSIYEKLKEVARARRLITYGEVAEVVDLDWRKNYGKCRQIFVILKRICADEVRQGCPMLGAMVVGKRSNIPGEGFFTSARKLGFFQGDDKLAFWTGERERVYDYWASH